MNGKELEAKFNPSKQSTDLFMDIIKCEALVKITKEKYEPIYQSIFEKYSFVNSFDGKIITKREHVCFDSDEDKWNKYFAECKEVLHSVGYAKAKEGICPILEVESLEREANRLFAESMFNDLQKLNLMDGVEFKELLYSMPRYKKFLEICKNIMVAKGITI